MTPTQDPLHDLREIRHLMQDSTRFLSLSGLSGISAGLIALLGAWGTYAYLQARRLYGPIVSEDLYLADPQLVLELLGIAALIFVAAVGAAAFFTLRRARQQGKPLLTAPARRLILNLALPLLAGALFCLQLIWYGLPKLVAPATLLFYGLALLNAGKYTLREVRYLGLSEIALGLLAGLFPGYGIAFWAVGFGLLHILYGTLMYLRYERGERRPQ
jgi:hypothetical protein